ncbi:MAG: hypothetical protein K0S32_1362 [Bacteroidetes bacterium]|jgi:hypothetical protein|nr:hypothetical protein [Bacteroidota bacterium]
MKLQDSLHELVHSLTKTEKSFFRKFSAIQSAGDEHSYLRLFEILEKMSDYDDGKVEDKLKADFPSVHYAFAKNYLKRTILRSLRAQKEEDSPNIIFSEFLSNAELLYKKNLITLSEKELQKAEKIMEQYELHHRFSELAYWKRQFLYKKGYSAEVKDEFEKVNETEKQHFEKTSNHASYYFLSYLILEINISKGNIRDEKTKLKLENILNHPLFFDESMALSTPSKCFYYNTWCLYYDYISNTEELYRHLRKNIAVIENNQPFYDQNEWWYAAAVYNYIVTGISLKRFDDYEVMLEKLKSISRLNRNIAPLLKNNIFVLILNAELRHLLGTGSYDKLKNFHEEHAQFLLLQDIKRNPHVLLENYLMMAYAFLMTRDLRSALKWNNILINAKVSDMREDVFSMARILNLVIHFELGNDIFLTYSIKSTHRYLEKLNTLKKFESLLLQFMKLLMDLEKKGNHSEKLKTLQDSITDLKGDPIEKQVFAIIDISHWLNFRIEQNSKRVGSKQT